MTTRDAFAHACGEMALAATVTGCLAAVPAALRFSVYAPGFWSAWMSLAGLGAIAALLAVVLIRGAQAGGRRLLCSPTQRSLGLVFVAIWTILSIGPLSGFGWALSAVTHHRGLGGATFALVGVGVVALCAAVAWRVAQAVRCNTPANLRQLAWTSVAFVCLGGGLLVFWALAKASHQAFEPSVLPVADVFLVLVLAVGTSQIRLPNRYKRVWVPVTVILLAVCMVMGLLTLNNLASAHAKARDQVRVVAPAINLILKPDAVTASPTTP